MQKLKIAGINFDHMHMGHLLRQAREQPDVELVAICDEQPERMAAAARELALPAGQIFTDYRRCLEVTKPDIVILCPATATHGLWVERVAPYGAHLLVEKPFAASLAEADAMMAAVAAAGRQMIINWPLAWYPPHVTSKRLIDEGMIGEVVEVHYYDGNRGPTHPRTDEAGASAALTAARKRQSWFYQPEQGGGSLLDYLGYGVTLGTWFHGGDKPIEVTAMVDEPAGLEVDEHSITVARYASGLSKFETRWGTFTDARRYQPQPKCGFVIVGSEGTISSYDYETTVRVQTRARPEGEVMAVDTVQPPFQNPIQNFAHSLRTGAPVHGPLSPAIGRIGQQIVDTAILSAREGRAVALLNG